MKKLITLIIILMVHLVGINQALLLYAYPEKKVKCEKVFGTTGKYVVIETITSVQVVNSIKIVIYMNYDNSYFAYETEDEQKSEFDRLLAIIKQCKFK